MCGSWAAALLTFLLLAACAAETGPAVQPSLTPIQAEGLRLFNLHCATCHSTAPGTIIVGPSLHAVAGRAGERVPGMDARTYLQTSILKPDAYIVDGFEDGMPKELGKQLTGEEFDAILAYLLTLD